MVRTHSIYVALRIEYNVLWSPHVNFCQNAYHSKTEKFHGAQQIQNEMNKLSKRKIKVWCHHKRANKSQQLLEVQCTCIINII